MALSSAFDEGKLILEYFKAHPPAAEPGTMIDVGAQFGTSFREYLGMGWRVIAVEPEATKHEKLRRFAGDERFTLVADAVGENASERAAFYTSEESTGIASLLAFRESHCEAMRVRVTTLRIIAKHDVRRLNYLKVDTEGYDLAVLRGFPWELTHVRPEVVMAEFDELKTVHLGHTYQAIGDLLLEQGYAVWLSEWRPIVRYGVEHTWDSIRQYPCELRHEKAWGNFIAVRGNADAAAMQRLVAKH
jgi:FkbM family methyltransferase